MWDVPEYPTTFDAVGQNPAASWLSGLLEAANQGRFSIDASDLGTGFELDFSENNGRIFMAPFFGSEKGRHMRRFTFALLLLPA